MQVQIEDVSPVEKKLRFEIPWDQVNARLGAAYDELSRTVALKGFRKGKVPRKVLEKNFGEKVKTEVADKMIQDTYFNALEETKLDAIVHPEVKDFKFEEDGSFSYEAHIEVRPTFVTSA